MQEAKFTDFVKAYGTERNEGVPVQRRMPEGDLINGQLFCNQTQNPPLVLARTGGVDFVHTKAINQESCDTTTPSDQWVMTQTALDYWKRWRVQQKGADLIKDVQLPDLTKLPTWRLQYTNPVEIYGGYAVGAILVGDTPESIAACPDRGVGWIIMDTGTLVWRGDLKLRLRSDTFFQIV